MAANKVFRFGPLALTNTYATNLLNPGTTTGGVNAGTVSGDSTSLNTYIILRHIRIVNKDSSARTFRLFLGATGAAAAGTEVVGYDVSIAAGSYFDWYGILRVTVADFLTGGASAVTALTIEGEGEIGIV